MPDLTIRDLPEDEFEALVERGRRHGRSVEEEARHLLHEAAAEQRIVTELERVTRAADASRGAAPTGSAPSKAAPPYRRRQRFEPTPRRG